MLPPPPHYAACVVLLLPRDATFDLATHHLGLLQAIMSWLAAKISEGTEMASDTGNAMSSHDAQEATASLDLQLQPPEGLRQRIARKHDT